jgi:hypothetical protein
MAYTEIKERNNRKYFYRVLSIRDNNKIIKKRAYLGVNLNKSELKKKEHESDKKLRIESPSFKKLKLQIVNILKKYKIKKAGIFGSYARGDYKKNSDIDILIEPSKTMGLEFVGMNLELEDKLKKKVDLVTYKTIHPLIREQILQDEIKII